MPSKESRRTVSARDREPFNRLVELYGLVLDEEQGRLDLDIDGMIGGNATAVIPRLSSLPPEEQVRIGKALAQRIDPTMGPEQRYELALDLVNEALGNDDR